MFLRAPHDDLRRTSAAKAVSLVRRFELTLECPTHDEAAWTGHPILGKVIRFDIPIDYAEIFLRRISMLASPATPLPRKTIEDGSGVTAPRKFAARIASAAVVG